MFQRRRLEPRRRVDRRRAPGQRRHDGRNSRNHGRNGRSHGRNLFVRRRGGRDGIRGSTATGSGGTTSGAGGATTGTGGSARGGIGGGVAGHAGGAGATGAGGTGGKPDQQALPAVTIHMAGDSTMSNYAATTTQEGWGQELGQFFISKVTIDNQAQPGANIQTFYSARWKTLIANVKAGDYVMAAFGINDSGTTHGPVTPANFQAQMGVMADEVAAKKATFIPTTSSPLQAWSGGKETNTRLQPYCDATIALGKSKGLLVTTSTRGHRVLRHDRRDGRGRAQVQRRQGALRQAGRTAMASLAAHDLARIDSPLAAYLK